MKQGVHHCCTLTGIQVTTEQISLLTHHHVTNQAFGIIIVQRHIWDVYIIGQLIIDGITFFLTKDYPLTLLSKYHSDKRGYLLGLSSAFLSTSDSRISFASLSPIATSVNFGLLFNCFLPCTIIRLFKLTMKGTKLYLCAQYCFHKILTLHKISIHNKF